MAWQGWPGAYALRALPVRFVPLVFFLVGRLLLVSLALGLLSLARASFSLKVSHSRGVSFCGGFSKRRLRRDMGGGGASSDGSELNPGEYEVRLWCMPDSEGPLLGRLPMLRKISRLGLLLQPCSGITGRSSPTLRPSGRKSTPLRW